MADGYIVYQGPAEKSASFFNMSNKTNRYLNPCDFFMKVLTIDYPKSQEDEAKIDRYARVYRKELQPKVLAEIKEYKVPDMTLRDADTDVAPICDQYG